jgi:hypothetical protein
LEAESSCDVQGRLTGKQYVDTTTVAYAYETMTSRLKSIADALSQVKTFSYAKDNRLSGITYTGAVNPTPNVGFAYDAYFRMFLQHYGRPLSRPSRVVP